MNEATPCPYCGNIGYHVWAGSGGCPGAQEDPFIGTKAAIEKFVALHDEALKAVLREQDAEIEGLKSEVEMMTAQAIKFRDTAMSHAALLIRAADALEIWIAQADYITATIPEQHLIDELRKAGAE